MGWIYNAIVVTVQLQAGQNNRPVQEPKAHSNSRILHYTALAPCSAVEGVKPSGRLANALSVLIQRELREHLPATDY
eukprot:scaffold42275_cov34-Phaeocystis_antarctica.AAC.1